MIRTPVLLGIDAGTSGVKVCAFTLGGVLLSKAQENISVISEEPGFVEMDVALYWEKVKQAIRTVTAGKDLKVVGIGLSATCPTVITMDEHFAPLGKGITYLDQRASGKVREYLARFESPEAYAAKIGNRCSISTCSASTMMWIRDNQKKRWDGTAHIGMLNSYLAACLAGQGVVDTTQASYSGLFRLSRPDDWDDELLQIAGIPREKLLPVSKPASRIGCVLPQVARSLGLDEGIPLAIGSGDTAAAAFALGFDAPDEAFESAGTSGVLTFVMDKPETNPIFMNRCHVFPNRWLAHGANAMMGGALEWLRSRVFTDFQDYKAMDAQAELATPGAHGVVFLPYLAGERCPVWNPEAKAVWYGMTLETDKTDLVESVFEAGAFSMCQIRDLGEKLLGVSIQAVTAVGNGTKSDHWCQMKADVMQVVYTTASHADAAAYGAALMGGIAAGIFASAEDPAIPFLKPDGKTFSPRGEEVHNAYKKSYDIYTRLYPSLEKIVH